MAETQARARFPRSGTPERALRDGFVWAVVGLKGNLISAHQREDQAKSNSGALRQMGATIVRTETLVKRNGESGHS